MTVRAMRTAPITASEPVLQNATRSAPVISENSSATSAARGVCGPISMPVSIWRLTASFTKSGCQPKWLQPKPFSTST